jgi:hypothetical protein
MALSFERLKEILTGFEVSYWTMPERPAVMFGMTARSGKGYMLGASVDSDGTLFQVRSVEYASCPPGHRHFRPVAQLLLALNYRYRAIKFALDPQDGEIAAFADLVLLDAEATPGQLMGLMGFFLNILDDCHERIQVTVATGEDPGEPPEEPEEPDEEEDVV